MRANSTINERIERICRDFYEKSTLERDHIRYIPSTYCQISLPKRLENTNEMVRTIRNRKFTFVSPSEIGIPGGIYSRFIILYLNTLAKRHKSREIYVGSTLSEFMQCLGFDPSGGKNGNLRAFKEHFIRCINCVLHTESHDGKVTEYSITTVIDHAEVRTLDNWRWSSNITLSETFYTESKRSVPTDIAALMCLSPGTLRFDLFNFLVWRLFYLKRNTLIPWKELYAMFASPKISTKSFRQNFKKALNEAKAFYVDANAEITKRGLMLMPSRMFIQPL